MTLQRSKFWKKIRNLFHVYQFSISHWEKSLKLNIYEFLNIKAYFGHYMKIVYRTIFRKKTILLSDTSISQNKTQILWAY